MKLKQIKYNTIFDITILIQTVPTSAMCYFQCQKQVLILKEIQA